MEKLKEWRAKEQWNVGGDRGAVWSAEPSWRRPSGADAKAVRKCIPVVIWSRAFQPGGSGVKGTR